MPSVLIKPLLIAALALGAASAHAQAAFPSGPIKLVVPYVPGGLPDTVARILSQRLQVSLGQSVLVENKPGASGAVAAAAIAQAPADGHTLLLTDGQLLAITPLLSSKPSYDATKDFVPVSLVGTAPLFLAVHPNVKANNLDEFIALVKSKPGALNYGSAGIGSPHHLTAEAMKEGLGLFITHIPFRGSGASMPAMVGGQVDMVFASPPSLMGFVKSGQARLIAINASKRSALAPDVPALAEKIPGFDFAFTIVVLAKTGTPPAAVSKLSEALAAAVKHPEATEALRTAGVDAIGGSPDDLARAMRAEGARVAAAAKRANLKSE
jgi:tripartite-type tricarboxylate transporter receptor subunit TctC